ncbi:MAG: SDR family NAD(P)-dependent oxidoreductase [Bacteroidia bacterium]|nr:MAG: SDR family NAD(P)-dependent oxidoreductase [Bacteroidia bacterium]
MKKNWSVDDIPLQKGRIAVVTGANSGLGYHTALALALKGAKVIMACRSLEKGEMARQKILTMDPEVELEVWHLDLASLHSVRTFAEKFHAYSNRLDLLINNAGLMAIPEKRTEEGFEMQFGVNYLSHFALTAQLWQPLSRTPGSRIIQVSSLAHKFGRIRFEDIHWKRKYSKWGAYGMSKLASLLFMYELAGRIDRSESEVIAAAAHPGYANTELQAKGAKMKGKWLGAALFNLANGLAAQSAAMGALPTLYAATAEDVTQGAYYGPRGFMRLWGGPALDMPGRKQISDEVAEELWRVSESLIGADFKV